MPIKPSGPLSFQEIAEEFNAQNPIDMGQFYRGGQYVPNIPQNQNVPTSGPISFYDMYNATNSTDIVIEAPFLSGSTKAYFDPRSSNFLPGGPLPEDEVWVVLNNNGSEESAFFAYSDPYVLCICDNIPDATPIDQTAVWNRLVSIDVMGTNKNVLANYTKAQLVTYTNSLGDKAFYIPMQSLGLIIQEIQDEQTFYKPASPAWGYNGGPCPLTDSNVNTFNPQGYLYLRWHFSP